jgi:hypothetical protein
VFEVLPLHYSEILSMRAVGSFRDEKGFNVFNFRIVLAAGAIAALGASSCFATEVDSAQPPAQPATVQTATATPEAAPAPATQPAPVAATTDPKKIVCKRLAPETGTRLGSRMQCLTNAQWDAITRQSQDAIRDNQKAGATFADSPG